MPRPAIIFTGHRQDYEPVKGWIESGKEGQFVVDIPMCTRAARFLHTAEMKRREHGFETLKSWEGVGIVKKNYRLTVQPDLFAKQGCSRAGSCKEIRSMP